MEGGGCPAFAPVLDWNKARKDVAAFSFRGHRHFDFGARTTDMDLNDRSDWTLRDLQRAVDGWIQESGGGYWKAPSQMLRIMEEVGELSRLVNHLFGEKPKKATEARQELPTEIGDLLFTLICLANSEGVDLQAATESALEKYRQRDRDRWKAQP
jgi:NTP pyrophosphatase (non-canonical NTP hydrolase)